ncbi:hypothetical protein LTR36_002299 [Oleoguttula mirabilis]|uniref:Uncharacterized protein n=1 Tax=Oleoguttula mirabilis TaxID=1507867 RepID=A0AAV9JKY8_9PEZI|nr:hypothetical protein LTR36_002299 [Oleoguttula mirabilis]
MKFSTAIVALAAVAAQAAAVREPAGKEHTDYSAAVLKGMGYGSAPGHTASHAKRAAEAVAEALAEAEPKKKKAKVVGGMFNFCGVPGSSCNGKREITDNLYNLASKTYNEIDRREADADAKHGLFNFCGVPGSSCNGKREAEPMKRDAKHGLFNFCGVPGSSCNGKREADAKHGLFNFCGVPGSSCNGKRAVAEEMKRDAKHGLFNFCGVPGSSCNGKRDAEADAKHGLTNFCGVPGSSCNEKRDAEAKHGLFNFCGVPGSSCNGKRTAELESAVKAINPDSIKAECFAEGEACDTIKTAHEALKYIQAREAEAARQSPAEKLAACGTSHDCSATTQAYLKALVAGEPAAKKAEAECHGPQGHCTLAARALEELSAAVEEGVASLSDF